jgi:mono/diheme cytochrome c family protein
MLRARFLLAVSLLAVSSRAACAADPNPPSWAEIAEIFAERCVMCHSDQGAGRGLLLDSYEAVLTGSERGAVLVPGDSGKSELIRRLRGESLPRMPFLSRPLPPDQIELIVRWVDAGLPGPSPQFDLLRDSAQGRFE